jgi:hypothetical protein
MGLIEDFGHPTQGSDAPMSRKSEIKKSEAVVSRGDQEVEL